MLDVTFAGWALTVGLVVVLLAVDLALAVWLQARVKLPVGPLFCIVNGPTRGRPWTAGAARSELRCVAREAGVRRRFAPHQLRHAHAARWPARACR